MKDTQLVMILKLLVLRSYRCGAAEGSSSSEAATAGRLRRAAPTWSGCHCPAVQAGGEGRGAARRGVPAGFDDCEACARGQLRRTIEGMVCAVRRRDGADRDLSGRLR